jgi:hypothetical protein
MTDWPRPFRYHAVDVDRDVVLGSYPSQAEATLAVLEEGESTEMASGERRRFAVRVESIESGHVYDIPLEVTATRDESGN